MLTYWKQNHMWFRQILICAYLVERVKKCVPLKEHDLIARAQIVRLKTSRKKNEYYIEHQENIQTKCHNLLIQFQPE